MSDGDLYDAIEAKIREKSVGQLDEPDVAKVLEIFKNKTTSDAGAAAAENYKRTVDRHFNPNDTDKRLSYSIEKKDELDKNATELKNRKTDMSELVTKYNIKLDISKLLDILQKNKGYSEVDADTIKSLIDINTLKLKRQPSNSGGNGDNSEKEKIIEELYDLTNLSVYDVPSLKKTINKIGDAARVLLSYNYLKDKDRETVVNNKNQAKTCIKKATNLPKPLKKFIDSCVDIAKKDAEYFELLKLKMKAIRELTDGSGDPFLISLNKLTRTWVVPSKLFLYDIVEQCKANLDDKVKPEFNKSLSDITIHKSDDHPINIEMPFPAERIFFDEKSIVAAAASQLSSDINHVATPYFDGLLLVNTPDEEFKKAIDAVLIKAILLKTDAEIIMITNNIIDESVKTQVTGKIGSLKAMAVTAAAEGRAAVGRAEAAAEAPAAEVAAAAAAVEIARKKLNDANKIKSSQMPYVSLGPISIPSEFLIAITAAQANEATAQENLKKAAAALKTAKEIVAATKKATKQKTYIDMFKAFWNDIYWLALKNFTTYQATDSTSKQLAESLTKIMSAFQSLNNEQNKTATIKLEKEFAKIAAITELTTVDPINLPDLPDQRSRIKKLVYREPSQDKVKLLKKLIDSDIVEYNELLSEYKVNPKLNANAGQYLITKLRLDILWFMTSYYQDIEFRKPNESDIKRFTEQDSVIIRQLNEFKDAFNKKAIIIDTNKNEIARLTGDLSYISNLEYGKQMKEKLLNKTDEVYSKCTELRKHNDKIAVCRKAVLEAMVTSFANEFVIPYNAWCNLKSIEKILKDELDTHHKQNMEDLRKLIESACSTIEDRKNFAKKQDEDEGTFVSWGFEKVTNKHIKDVEAEIAAATATVFVEAKIAEEAAQGAIKAAAEAAETAAEAAAAAQKTAETAAEAAAATEAAAAAAAAAEAAAATAAATAEPASAAKAAEAAEAAKAAANKAAKKAAAEAAKKAAAAAAAAKEAAEAAIKAAAEAAEPAKEAEEAKAEAAAAEAAKKAAAEAAKKAEAAKEAEAAAAKEAAKEACTKMAAAAKKFEDITQKAAVAAENKAADTKLDKQNAEAKEYKSSVERKNAIAAVTKIATNAAARSAEALKAAAKAKEASEKTSAAAAVVTSLVNEIINKTTRITSATNFRSAEDVANRMLALADIKEVLPFIEYYQFKEHKISLTSGDIVRTDEKEPIKPSQINNMYMVYYIFKAFNADNKPPDEFARRFCTVSFDNLNYITSLGPDAYACYLTYNLATLFKFKREDVQFAHDLEARGNVDELKDKPLTPLMVEILSYVAHFMDEFDGYQELESYLEVDNRKYVESKYTILAAFARKYADRLVVTYTEPYIFQGTTSMDDIKASLEKMGIDFSSNASYDDSNLLRTLAIKIMGPRVELAEELAAIKRGPSAPILEKVKHVNAEEKAARVENKKDLIAIATEIEKWMNLVNSAESSTGKKALLYQLNAKLAMYNLALSLSNQGNTDKFYYVGTQVLNQVRKADTPITGGGMHGGNENQLIERIQKQIDRIETTVDEKYKAVAGMARVAVELLHAEAEAIKKTVNEEATGGASWGNTEKTESEKAPTLSEKVKEARRTLRDLDGRLEGLMKTLNTYTKILTYTEVESILKKARSTDTDSRQAQEQVVAMNKDIQRVNVDELSKTCKELDENCVTIANDIMQMWKSLGNNPTYEKNVAIVDGLVNGEYEKNKLTDIQFTDWPAQRLDNNVFTEYKLKGLRNVLGSIVAMVRTCKDQSIALLSAASSQFDRNLTAEADNQRIKAAAAAQHVPMTRGFAAESTGGAGEIEYNTVLYIVEWVNKSLKVVLETQLDKLGKIAKQGGIENSSTKGSRINDNIYTVLLNQYIENRDTEGDILAGQNLRNRLIVNNLLPSQALALDNNDRFIFIVVTMIVRMIGVGLVNVMVNKGIVTKVGYSILMYLVIYVGIMFLLALAVNLDEYRLRILFNFLNFHINSVGFYTYIGVTIVLTMTIVAMMMYANFPFSNMGTAAFTPEERGKLVSRLQFLTLVTWGVGVIIVLIA
jgi:hypothetical protein